MSSAFRYIKRNTIGINREIVIDPFAEQRGYENPNLPFSESAIINCWRYFIKNSHLKDEAIQQEISKEDFNPRFHSRKFDWDCLIQKVDIFKIKAEVRKNIPEQQQIFLLRFHAILMSSKSEFAVKENLSLIVRGLVFAKKWLSEIQGNALQKEVAELYAESYSKTLSKLQKKYPEYFPSNNLVTETNKNPYPNIFTDQGYELFKRVMDENATYQADDFAFLFRKMTNDDLIYPIKQDVYKDFVNAEYGIRITKIKTLQELKTAVSFKSFYTYLKSEVKKP